MPKDNFINKAGRKIKTTYYKIKDYYYQKHLNRLEGDLRVLNQRISFNPYRIGKLSNELDTSTKFSERIEEYRVWYIGNERMIREFYREHMKHDNSNYFWLKAPIDYRLIHSGIPGLISRAMGQVVFGAGWKANVSVFKDETSKEIDESLTEQSQELVEGLIDVVDLKQKCIQASETESWCGQVFYKLSHDIDLSNFPILEIADVRQAEEIKVRGITTAIVFKHYYTHKKNENKIDYRLDEIYTTNYDDDATIIYELYKCNVSKKEGVTDELIDLFSIPETQHLIDIVDDEGKFVYKGVKGILALSKPNKLPSHEFMDINVGASDFEGSVGSFDALDEVYSEMIAEVRNNKTIRYIPIEMLPKHKDRDGNIHSVKPNAFITNYVEIESSKAEGTNKEIVIKQIEDKYESLKSKFATAITTCINQAGLSPFALGITGLESVNSSAESQQERNKVTLQTRSMKQEMWKPFLEKLLIKILELNSWMQRELKVEQPFSKLELSYNNVDIDIEFNPYIYPRQEDLLTTWGSAKQQRVASTYEAVSQIHPDWDDLRIEKEVNLIRFEEGLSLDTPELMQFSGEEEPSIEETIIEGQEETL